MIKQEGGAEGGTPATKKGPAHAWAVHMYSDVDVASDARCVHGFNLHLALLPRPHISVLELLGPRVVHAPGLGVTQDLIRPLDAGEQGGVAALVGMVLLGQSPVGLHQGDSGWLWGVAAGGQAGNN